MFDLSKIQRAALELGLDLQFNSKNPGFHFINQNGNVDIFTFDDLQKSLAEEFWLNNPKENFKYDFKEIDHFKVAIHNGDSVHTRLIIDEISLAIPGYIPESNLEIEFTTPLNSLTNNQNYKSFNMEAA